MKRLALLILSFSPLFSENASPGYIQIEDKATIPILTPSLAERKTAKIRLSNELEVYLISDPGVDQSAAAMAVEAGSWNDPKEYPGMAHFLEHMLFMGNKAYPQEFEYMQYITDHGGKVNAYTASDRTVYMFSVNNDAFEGALDRFSHFFIDPLFLPSCIGRELHAVDQEHAKNIENDNWREYLILKETGNPHHPNAGFSTGNAATLSGIPQEALKTWYKQNYSSNRMHLVLLSSLPLEEMIQSTVQKFSLVPDYHLPAPAHPAELLSDHQRGHTIYIQPVKDLKSLTLLWQPASEYASDLDHKTLDLVAYALGQGGEDSLIQELKKEKLAEGIHVGADHSSKEHVFFQISIDLTELGVKSINTVIERCFQAIALLKEKGVPSYLFEEMKEMALLNYQYQSREDAFSFITQAAGDIMKEALTTYPEKTSIPTSFDPELTHTFIKSLTPQSCIYIVAADPKLTGVETTQREKWMDAAYTIKSIPQETLAQWAEAKPDARFGLPASNPFIPRDLTLLSITDTTQDPVLIAQDSGSKIYALQDKKYLVPEVALMLNLKTPELNGSAKSTVLFDLYQRALIEKLYSPLFFASCAGLQLTTSQRDLGMQLTVTGYSEKAPLFLKAICETLQKVHPSQEEFGIYKDSILSDYDNASKELPLRQAGETLSSIVYNDAPSSTLKYEALNALSYEEFIRFCSTVFKKSYVEGLLYGNITPTLATELWTSLKPLLIPTPYPIEEHAKKMVLLLPPEQGPFMISQTTERQGNAAMLMIQQGPFSFERRAAQQLLSIALQEGFFETLRTKQQTGYIAMSWNAEVEKQLLHFFAVQSITHQPTELLARFELFLEEFNRDFPEKIPVTRFESLRSMLIKLLEMPPENLQSMAFLLNTLAFKHEGDFQWMEKRIQGVKDLSYEGLMQDSKAFFSRKNLRRMALLIEGVLPIDNTFRYEEVTPRGLTENGKYVSAP